MISQSEAPAPEEIEVYKQQRDLFSLSVSAVETNLTRGTRSSVTPEKRIPKKKKYIKPLALSPLRKGTIPNQDFKNVKLNKYQCLTLDVPPFLPVNKILLNKDNDDNPKTRYTSQSEKDDTSHTS